MKKLAQLKSLENFKKKALTKKVLKKIKGGINEDIVDL